MESPGIAFWSDLFSKTTKATFQCVPNPCSIPDVKNTAGSGCEGIKGDKVDSGKAMAGHNERHMSCHELTSRCKMMLGIAVTISKLCHNGRSYMIIYDVDQSD